MKAAINTSFGQFILDRGICQDNTKLILTVQVIPNGLAWTLEDNWKGIEDGTMIFVKEKEKK